MLRSTAQGHLLSPALKPLSPFKTSFRHSIQVAGGQFYLDKLVVVTSFSSKVKSSLHVP